jgi:hypothetical protein
VFESVRRIVTVLGQIRDELKGIRRVLMSYKDSLDQIKVATDNLGTRQTALMASVASRTTLTADEQLESDNIVKALTGIAASPEAIVAGSAPPVPDIPPAPTSLAT